jgi:hypothetical protein
VLDERRFAVLAAIAARTVRAPGADPAEIAHTVDAHLQTGVAEERADLLQLLSLFENALAGALLDGRFRPFTRLSGEAQDRVLATWRGSRIAVRRVGYQALKKLTCAAHYASLATWPSVGYPGPPTISQPT